MSKARFSSYVCFCSFCPLPTPPPPHLPPSFPTSNRRDLETLQLCTTLALSSGSVFLSCLRIQDARAVHPCQPPAWPGPPGLTSHFDGGSPEEETVSLWRATAVGLNSSTRIYWESMREGRRRETNVQSIK